MSRTLGWSEPKILSAILTHTKANPDNTHLLGLITTTPKIYPPILSALILFWVLLRPTLSTCLIKTFGMTYNMSGITEVKTLTFNPKHSNRSISEKKENYGCGWSSPCLPTGTSSTKWSTSSGLMEISSSISDLLHSITLMKRILQILSATRIGRAESSSISGMLACSEIRKFTSMQIFRDRGWEEGLQQVGGCEPTRRRNQIPLILIMIASKILWPHNFDKRVVVVFVYWWIVVYSGIIVSVESWRFDFFLIFSKLPIKIKIRVWEQADEKFFCSPPILLFLVDSLHFKDS